MRTSRLAKVLVRRPRVFLAIAVLAVLAVPGAALAHDGRTILIMDRCDPTTFNAAIGPGTCVRNGGVPFAKFLSKANPKDGGHHAWRFSRHDVSLEPGERLNLENVGGETHTFTEVVDFGTGNVPRLNEALPPGTPAAQPIGDLRFIPAGGSAQIDGLSAGTHRFECLIHPWMRTVVHQEDDDD